MDDDLEIAAFSEPYNLSVALYARQGDQVATGFTFREGVQGEMPSPLARVHIRVAQSLMDSLWRAGLRPAAGKQSEGVTAAQDAHLQDMRALAFAKLNVPVPQNKTP